MLAGCTQAGSPDAVLDSPKPEPAQIRAQAPDGEAYDEQPIQALPELGDLTGLAPQRSVQPLRLAFSPPDAVPEPVWRPPPYPVPWSLRPEDHFWLARPIGSDSVNWPQPDYRYGGTYFGQLQVHAGLDFDAPLGTEVLASAEGTVVWAGWGLLHKQPWRTDDPYGKAVALEHEFGLDGKRLYTVYAHLSRILVSPGETVTAGQPVGEVGVTGFTTGDHLHFEVRLGGNDFVHTRNPELWLAPPQGWGVLAGRITDDTGYPIFGKTLRIQSEDTGQKWTVWTYGSLLVHPDDLYGENFAIGDLPAGEYTVSMEYVSWRTGWKAYRAAVTVVPGATTLVAFQPNTGLTVERRPDPLPLPPGPPPPLGK